jgi:hypothetical protein
MTLSVKRLPTIDHDALKIYVQCMARDIATNTNEIVYWWERSEEFKPNELIILGIYLNDKMIGYVQMVDTPRFLCIDYIAMDKLWRTSSIFSKTLDKVFEWIDNVKKGKLIVTEVERKGFIKVLAKYGFQAVKVNYQTPLLGKRPTPMTLLANRDVPHPKWLVFHIYFEHYLHWYSIYDKTDKFLEFRYVIDDLIENI